MVREGQVVLFKFPPTGQAQLKLRPALVIRKLPGHHEDWLICMISAQLSQAVPVFDDIVSKKDEDFLQSGLKQESAIRITRLAVVHKSILSGGIGEIRAERLQRIKRRLSDWIIGK